MKGLQSRQIVLIHCESKENDQVIHSYGTGYLFSKSIVLTASHVMNAKDVLSAKIRMEFIDKGSNSHWASLRTVPVWSNEQLDVSLLGLQKPLSENIYSPEWEEADFSSDQDWQSSAYPNASAIQSENGQINKTAGLKGTLYANGGGGQGLRELELSVEDEATKWQGISGAPVFINGKLAGVIKSSFSSFAQRRISATPVKLFVREPAFQMALKPTVREHPSGSWVMILNPENTNDELADMVVSALEIQNNLREESGEQLLSAQPLAMSITEVLQSPEDFLEFVHLMCTAPIMMFDVTDFEPAVMLCLGIRSVVRRGVTVTTTWKYPDESLLNESPFNIQGSKTGGPFRQSWDR